MDRHLKETRPRDFNHPSLTRLSDDRSWLALPVYEPIAAGVLFPITSLLLSPLIAALAMSVSLRGGARQRASLASDALKLNRAPALALIVRAAGPIARRPCGPGCRIGLRS